MDKPTYYEQVRDKVEEIAIATTSDAQAIIEAWERTNGQSIEEDTFGEAEHAGTSPEDLARLILRMPATPPTKAEELEALRKFAAAQHPAGYLSAWMRELIPHVEQDMRSDIEPTDTPHTLRQAVIDRAETEIRLKAQEMRKELKDLTARREELRAQIKAGEDKVKQAERYRDEAIQAVRRALSALGDL